MADTVPATSSERPSKNTTKRRTPISCDRCKSRKTKCVDPEPGPCKYCAHIGVPCRLSTRRNQRPFYHVTEEEYRCSRKILEHLLSSEDLTLERLRALAADIDKDSNVSITSPTLKGEDDTTEPEVEEVGDLHDELGCLMEDSLGEYRYVGAHSEIVFNAAVCSIKAPSSPENIIEPSKFSFPPRQSPSFTVPSRGRLYLPPRACCNQYVARYFEQVHCVYWLYPAEMFYMRLDATYSDGGQTSSSSWLCALYSIFALGSARSAGDLYTRAHDSKSTDDYLALAKARVPDAQDEADIDSVRALALLGIALQTFGFRITSYLYMGTSVRIAFSLGLHHDQVPETQTHMTKEQNRRVWWTLFLLDQAISSRCGSPFIIDERSLAIQTPLPSERIATPGTNTPLGILSISTSICRLRRHIIQTIYPERSADNRPVSFGKITNFLSELQSWNKRLPSHLKWGVPLAPSHRRAVAILHLKYWDARMLVTQPFLLYLVLRGKDLSASKRAWFDNLGETCIEAAKSALGILKKMSHEKTLSSLITLDVTVGLKVAMVLVLAFVRSSCEEYREDIECCLSIVQGMEEIGFAGTAVKELPMRLAELGILRNPKREDQLDSNDFQVGAETDFHFLDSVENLQHMNGDFGNPFWMDQDMDMNMFQQTPATEHFQFDFLPGT